MSLKNSALTVALSTLVLHVLLDSLYRPWAWNLKLSDAHFADSFTNLTSVVGISALMVFVEGQRFWKEKMSSWLIVVVPAVSMIVYEGIQMVLPWGRFDTWDLAWTASGAVLAWVIKVLLYDPRAR